MRLIDADALVADDRPGFNKFFSADDIRTAPTVRCEECEASKHPVCSIRRAHEQYWTSGNELPADFGCAYFERREP